MPRATNTGSARAGRAQTTAARTTTTRQTKEVDRSQAGEAMNAGAAEGQPTKKDRGFEPRSGLDPTIDASAGEKAVEHQNA